MDRLVGAVVGVGQEAVFSSLMIVDEGERLRWRIWNSKAKNAKRSINRVRKVMHVYKDELGQHTRNAPWRRLWYAPLRLKWLRVFSIPQPIELQERVGLSCVSMCR